MICGFEVKRSRKFIKSGFHHSFFKKVLKRAIRRIANHDLQRGVEVIEEKRNGKYNTRALI
jgi:hypothetical protein